MGLLSDMGAMVRHYHGRMCQQCYAKSSWMPRRGFLAAMGAAAAAPALAQVQVGEASRLRSLVPADQLETAATQEYGKLLAQARQQGALAPESHPQLQALRAISSRLITQSARWNERASKWRWEVNLIGSKQVNAFCMPGGKIGVYSGLIQRLQLTDDELAAILGHEIAHALREHGRERVSQQLATNTALAIGAAVLGVGQSAASLGALVADVTFTLPNSRTHEIEADRIGVELSARAGYDPRGAITVWQKMARADTGSPPQFLSTHPSSENRIRDLEVYAERVKPVVGQP